MWAIQAPKNSIVLLSILGNLNKQKFLLMENYSLC